MRASTRAGTRIEVHLGPALAVQERDLDMARLAIHLSRGGEEYRGKTSPHWYDDDAWYELVQSAPRRQTVRQFVEGLDGCTSNARAGLVARACDGRLTCTLTRQDAVDLRRLACSVAKPVTHKRLGRIGPNPFLGAGYASVTGDVDGIPFVLEVWVDLLENKPAGASGHTLAYHVLVNKTPVTSTISADYRPRARAVCLFGCELKTAFKVGTSVPTRLCINVQTPAVPLTNDGKSPDLFPLRGSLQEALTKALRAARLAGPDKKTIKDSVYDNIPAGIEARSEGGLYLVTQRGLYYAIRDEVRKETGFELKFDTFTPYLTDYENENGAIPELTRDPRGTLYIPHLELSIPLGTVSVRDFQLPEFSINKVLYIEKEGLFDLLIKARWPHRHDCALMSSKGFTTRAVKDLIDQVGDGDEQILFFCVHDGDAAGSLIYQTLQMATKAREARRVTIVNLGLEPWEAREMGLSFEEVVYSTEKPVADYIRAHGGGWETWLQTHRYELDAMPPRDFLAWLDGKMAAHGQGKIMPAPEVMEEHHLCTQIERQTRRIEQAAFKAFGRDEKVAAAARALRGNTHMRASNANRLGTALARVYARDDSQSWRHAISSLGRYDLRRWRPRRGATCRVTFRAAQDAAEAQPIEAGMASWPQEVPG
jgi:hypothetical protein